jgi:hypothetical protein
MTFKAKANFHVQPAGSAVVASLPNGKHEVEIIETPEGEEASYINVKYPDGFTRVHDTPDLDDLKAKIERNLKGRYGVKEVEFLNSPESMEPGTIFEVDVTNGA